MLTDLEYALELDRADELARFRAEFVVNDPDLIYLDGNSLGRLPRRSITRLHEAIEREWGDRLIRGWNEGWYAAPQRAGAQIARLIGAEPDEVIVCDSTSVNLYKLVMAALTYAPNRKGIVTDDLNFPSDLYILQGTARLLGSVESLSILHSHDGFGVSTEMLAAEMNEHTALVTLTHTAFKSGFVYDMAAITALARRVGALVLWDLSHSVGAMPLNVHRAGADLAVGCTYKYLNGGPGAPAFLYVRRELQEALRSPIWGWFSQRDPFDFDLAYRPAPGMARFMAGTPPMLSLAAIEPALDLLLEAGLDKLRGKSVQQTEYLIALWEEWLAPFGVTLNSPRDSRQRGSHVSLGHPDMLRIDRALIETQRVIPDFRYPDNLRLGLAPLYTTFADIYHGMARLRTVLAERLYETYPNERPQVT